MKFQHSFGVLSSAWAVFQSTSVSVNGAFTIDDAVEGIAGHFLDGREMCGTNVTSTARQDGEGAIRACIAGEGYGPATTSVIDTLNCFSTKVGDHLKKVDKAEDIYAILNVPDGIASKAIVQYMRFLDGLIERLFPIFQNPFFSKFIKELLPCTFPDGMPKFLGPIVDLMGQGTNLDKAALYNAVGDMLESLLLDPKAEQEVKTILAACANPYTDRWDSTWFYSLSDFKRGRYEFKCEGDYSYYNCYDEFVGYESTGHCEELCPRLTGAQTPNVEASSFEVNYIQFLVDNVEDVSQMVDDSFGFLFDLARAGVTNKEVYNYMCAKSTNVGSVNGIWSTASQCAAKLDIGAISAVFQDIFFNGPQEDMTNCGLPISKLTCPSATEPLLPFYKQDRFPAALLQAAAGVDVMSMMVSPMLTQLDNFATLCSQPFEDITPPGGDSSPDETAAAIGESVGAGIMLVGVATIIAWRNLE